MFLHVEAASESRNKVSQALIPKTRNRSSQHRANPLKSEGPEHHKPPWQTCSWTLSRCLVEAARRSVSPHFTLRTTVISPQVSEYFIFDALVLVPTIRSQNLQIWSRWSFAVMAAHPRMNDKYPICSHVFIHIKCVVYIYIYTQM